MDYQTTLKVKSTACPGVSFAVRRSSFSRRLILLRQVRDLLAQMDFQSGGASQADQFAAAHLQKQVDLTYLRWGLALVDGLKIDGEAANADTVIDRGPEELVREVLTAIHQQLGLSEDQRKN